MKLFSNTELHFFNLYSVNLQKNQNCLQIVYLKCKNNKLLILIICRV